MWYLYWIPKIQIESCKIQIELLNMFVEDFIHIQCQNNGKKDESARKFKSNVFLELVE